MGAFESIGLSLHMYEPLWTSTDSHLADLSRVANSYSHSISAAGGYDTCEFSIGVNKDAIPTWLLSIGNRIHVRDRAANPIWSGFINRVSIKVGGSDLVIGPLMEVSNKVAANYQEASLNVAGITVGGNSAITSFFEDTESQRKYGIREQLYNVSQVYGETEAEQIAQAVLANIKTPAINYKVSFSSSDETSVKIECLGFVHMLKAYYYLNVNTSTESISAKLANIIDADVNSIFSSGNAEITTNSTTVPEYEDGTKTAYDCISENVVYSDSSYNRYVWGVRNEQEFYYEPAPTTIDYYYDVFGNDPTVRLSGEVTVNPWNIQPGKFLLISDANVGATYISAPREDPRVMFIESVKFTAPSGIELNSGEASSLSQRLGALGLNGLWDI